MLSYFSFNRLPDGFEGDRDNACMLFPALSEAHLSFAYTGAGKRSWKGLFAFSGSPSHGIVSVRGFGGAGGSLSG
jgi:hypothetical protein